MRLSTVVILITTLVMNVLIWFFYNKPQHPIESNYSINSFSFNPFKKDQSPYDTHYISAEDLDSDLELIAKKTHTIRLYSSRGGLDQVPELAKKYNMTVIASAYLDDRVDYDMNDLEVEAVVKLAKSHKNITHVIVGNETQLHKSIPYDKLINYLQYARKKLKTPVSTAEPWDYWLNHPELADEVDFIAIHVLPYWAEVPVEQAVDYVLDRYQTIKKRFPNKLVMIAETGWPSDGPQKGAAVASLTHQAEFVRDFIQKAGALKIHYNIIEAFDQPWKQMTEGRAGEHWGIMDADRHEKFPLTGPVQEDAKWKYWALSSTIIGFLAASFFLYRRRNLNKRGQFFSVVIFQIAAAFAVQMAREASNQYMSPGDILFWTFMISTQVLLAIILLTDAVEIAEVVGDKPLSQKYVPYSGPLSNPPLVSIHVACCREPPEMVIATINSLAKMDYPNFEVLVVDNNTPDPALWMPVKKRCEELGSHFRFFTLGKWPGFKAGALNFALKQTHPDAQVVGVVDADYIVEREWLRSTVPYYRDEEIAIVQAPQEHRDWAENIFQTMENDEYTGFFRIGMVQRNEHNAIIQHGTMTLIRRSVLDELGGWAEWCICEDSELGLRVLNLKKKAIYIDYPFGHGLVPDTYEAYAKQRFRWAYGGMRIFRHHWRKVFGLEGNLNRYQRYQFLKGWLPWMGDALHMLFTLTAIVWSVKLMWDPLKTDFPEAIFIYPALGLVLVRIFGTLWTYMARVRIGGYRTLMAMVAGGSLTHKIAKAVFQGLFLFSQPFYRTPKMAFSAPLLKSLLSAREEIFLLMALVGSAIGVSSVFGWVNDEAVLWSMALVIQAFPYIAAVIASVVSSRQQARMS